MRHATFALTVLVSAALLMMVQPMAARMLLPRLGGSPNVWNACVAFFQLGLLAGYTYAWLGPRWLGVRGQATLHLALVAAAALTLPFELSVAPDGHPALAVFAALLRGVGVAYFTLAATSTLVQQWYARATGEDPYFLYAISNVGSLLGLFLYPLVIEPVYLLSWQANLWQALFFVFAASMVIVILIAFQRPRIAGSVPVPISARPPTEATGPSWAIVLRWVLLAMSPSSLMLSVTSLLTTDLAPAPLLWIVPLAIYLLTFAIAFARRPIVSQAKVGYYLPMVVLVLALVWFSEATAPLLLLLAIHLVGFAWLALFCHGELAQSRPAPDRLGAFFFWIALGGVLGGVFSAFVAPVVFPSLFEYPLMIVLIVALGPVGGATRKDFVRPLIIGAAMLLLTLLGLVTDVAPGPMFLTLAGVPLVATLFVPKSMPYALALGLIFAVGALWPSVHGDIVERRRGFFGIHRVALDGEFVRLIHGNTIHGIQSMLKPEEPLAYYHRETPIAAVIEGLNKSDRLREVGVVGLGAGALAAYGKPGQTWTFFEIDPDVVDLARNRFRYLRDSEASVRVVLGDARLSLEKSSQKFDLLIIDAFGSDAIPTHLATAEAMEIYAAHLKPGGVLAFHVSNRYVNLFPVLGSFPGWSGWGSEPEAWFTKPAEGKLASWWAVLVRDPSDFPRPSGGWRPLPAQGPAWSDDFLNVPAVVRWREILSGE